jgi:hypothetical protein
MPFLLGLTTLGGTAQIRLDQLPFTAIRWKALVPVMSRYFHLVKNYNNSTITKAREKSVEI